MYNLAFDFSAPPPPIEVVTALPIVEEVKREIKEDCGGYSTWATYGAALYMENEFAIYEAIRKAHQSRTLNVKKLESLFRTHKLQLEEWMTGAIVWEEILEGVLENLGEEGLADDSFIPDNTRLSRDALVILSQAEIDGNVLKLTCGQVDRRLYQDVSDILEKLGGKWNRKSGGFVFKHDPSEKLDDVLTTGTVEKPEKFGYFPTPEPLARQIVQMAEIEEGMRVLEPSAGSANLADQIACFVKKQNIECFELQEENCQTLTEKGYRVTQGDFMKIEPCGTFDRVVMNPPFERQQDIQHVLHACNFLRPGGRLVAIMSASFTFRQDKRSADFRDYVKTYGYFIENPEGSFKSSGTMVNTVTVVLDRPAEAEFLEAA